MGVNQQMLLSINLSILEEKREKKQEIASNFLILLKRL